MRRNKKYPEKFRVKFGKKELTREDKCDTITFHTAKVSGLTDFSQCEHYSTGRRGCQV